MFTHVNKIKVSIWGRTVGTIVATTRTNSFAFAYDKDFLKSGIEIAPFGMPLSKKVYCFDGYDAFCCLPPVFADSLPDAFGTSIIVAWMRSQGVAPSEITPLDKLAYIGQRGIGALVYEPIRSPFREKPFALDMREVIESSRIAFNSDLAKMGGNDALRSIIRVGSSAGGAQAKAVVGWNRDANEFLVGDQALPSKYEHWLLKITPKEYPNRGKKEFEIYQRATSAGITMSQSEIYELDGISHFITKRFDREKDKRHHIISFSALAHLPMITAPENRSYEQLFACAKELGLEYSSIEQLFRRMAFNVLIGEFDDHTKNFSFMLKEGEAWELAPAYDLTGSSFDSNDPWNATSGLHQLSINGKFSNITKDDMLKLADRVGVGNAAEILNDIKNS